MQWFPKPHQERGLNMIMEQGPAGLLLLPGSGKTATTLAGFTILQNARAVSKLLIIAPLRVCYSVWPLEIEKWDDFKHLSYHILHDKGKKNIPDADVYIINPEGLKWLFESGTINELGTDVLCIDESSRFKGHGSERFKMLRQHLSMFKRRWILTGTPAPQGVHDLWSQIYILDRGAALGQYITHFRKKFFNQGGFGGYEYFLKEGAFDEIMERIRPLAVMITPDDDRGLPALRIGGQWDIQVELPPKAMEQYKAVEDKFLHEVDGGTIVANNAAAAGTKCRQIANGAVYVETYDEDGLPVPDSREWWPIHDRKLQALESLVEELGGTPLLVFYEFKHDMERIQGKFDAPSISGSNAAAGERLVREFNEGKLPILLAHPASAGHGLNLQGSCHTVCWYGLTWNLEHYEQGIARVYRQGQEHPVTVYRILAKGTLDTDVAIALENKAEVQDHIMDSLREQRA